VRDAVHDYLRMHTCMYAPHLQRMSMRSMRSMRGGLIFRNRGPSLKVHVSESVYVRKELCAEKKWFFHGKMRLYVDRAYTQKVRWNVKECLCFLVEDNLVCIKCDEHEHFMNKCEKHSTKWSMRSMRGGRLSIRQRQSSPCTCFCIPARFPCPETHIYEHDRTQHNLSLWKRRESRFRAKTWPNRRVSHGLFLAPKCHLLRECASGICS
jgi:hypothetical protein